MDGHVGSNKLYVWLCQAGVREIERVSWQKVKVDKE
jgi:hypothetical protein